MMNPFTRTVRVRAGTTLVELLVASLIMGVSIIATFTIWSNCGRLILYARDASVADNLARSQIEEIRVLGYTNLPIGNRSVVQSLWGRSLTGFTRVDGGGNAVVGTQTFATRNYDKNGVPVVGMDDPTYTLVMELADVDVLDGSSTYELYSPSRRLVRVRVYRYPDTTTPVATMGAELAKGGL